MAALRAHRREQATERLAFADVYVDRDVIFAQEDGSPTHPDRLLDAFHRISAAAGLRRSRPHDLRYGWTTRALEAGVPAKVVQEVLGHSSAMVTLDIYSHVVPSIEDRRRAARRRRRDTEALDHPLDGSAPGIVARGVCACRRTEVPELPPVVETPIVAAH